MNASAAETHSVSAKKWMNCPPHGPQGLAANANPWPGAFNSRCAGASPRLKLLSSSSSRPGRLRKGRTLWAGRRVRESD